MIIRKKATVNSLQGKRVIVQMDDGQNLELSSEDGGKYQLNDQLVISIMPAEEAQLDQQALAREIINQLLVEGKT